MVDLKNGVHQSTSGDTSPLTLDQKESLEKVFQDFISKDAFGPKKTIMFMKLVGGENFLDFVSSEKYSLLPENLKIELFMRIGAVSLFDLILGNTDRFFQVMRGDNESDGYTFDPSIGPNLGNMMIDWDGQSPSIVVQSIDNLIDPALISDKASIELYRQFLTEQVNSGSLAKTLAENILANLKWASGPDEEETSEAEIGPDLQLLYKDLNDSKLGLFKHLECGILNAMRYIDDRIIPYMHDELGKAELSTGISKDLLQIVYDRFDIFKNRKKL